MGNPSLIPSTFDVLKLRGESVTINSQDLTVLVRDPDSNVLLARGTATINDGASGYAKGARYIETDITTGNVGEYTNVGTTTSCNFDLISTGTGGGSGIAGSLDSGYNVGASISMTSGPIVLNDATTGAADTFQISKTGAGSGDAIQIALSAADTGRAIYIDMDAAIAATGISLDNGATARTGADILVTGDSTGTHSVFDVNWTGSGTMTVLDFDGTYAGSPAGSVLDINFGNAGNLDTTAMVVTAGTGNRGVLFDINANGADSGTTSHIFDIDIGGVLDSNVIDIAFATVSTGNAFLATMDNAVAATAIRVVGGGVRTQPFIELIGTQTGSVDMIDISCDGAFTGDAFDIDMTTAVGARVFAITGAGARTANIIDITDSSTGNTEVIDINMSGVYTGNIIDVALSAAATGTVLAIDMDAAVAGKALFLDAGNAIRTAAMALVTMDGSGATAGSTLFDINVTNTGATGAGLFDIDVTGVYTGAIMDIAYGAAATGDCFKVDLTSALDSKFAIITGAGARVDDIFEINDSSSGNSHVFDINMSGVYTGNILDITFSASAATSSAIKLAMGTNVAGQAIEVTSAGTGVTDEGCILDVEHTGALVAGADLVNIHSTGNISSTSTLLSVIQDTGAGTTGAYAAYISATGANVEALKVDDGAVVFDETLTVSGATSLSTVLFKDLTEVVSATNVITAAESGSVFFLNSGVEFVSTLPAVAAGLHFTFIVSAAPAGASYTIVTNASANIIVGKAFPADGAAGDTGASDDTISFVDGQSVAGDRVEVWSDGTSWFATAFCSVAAGVTFTTAS